ncbi:MAG: insulinase family protein [Phycisphaerales bacterium]
MLRHLAALAALMLLVLLAPRAAAQGFEADPRVTSGTLDNGLRYLVVPIDEPSRGAAVRLIVDAGLVHETENQYGTADVAAQAARAAIGSDATATIAGDHAVVSLNLTDASALGGRLSAFSTLVAGQAIRADALAAAKVAAAESLARVPAEQRIHSLAMRRLMPTSRAVRRPAAGMPDAVRALTPDAIQAFAQRWYVPSNATLIVVAPGDAEALVGQVRAAFGSLARVPRPASPATPAASWTRPAAPIIIEDPGVSTPVFSLVSAAPNASANSIRAIRAELVAHVALDVLENIAQVRLVKDKVPFSAATCDTMNGPEGLRWTAFHVTGDAVAWDQVLAAAIAEANRIRIHGIETADVGESLIAMATELEAQAQAETTGPASTLADALVESRGGPSAAQRLELLFAQIRNISADDAEWAFGRYIDPGVSAMVLAIPAQPGAPTEQAVSQAAQAAWAQTPEPAIELVRPWLLAPALPTPGEVVEIAQDPETQVWSGWLSNGIRFHFRQMQGRQPGGVEFSASIAGSQLLEDADTRGLSELVGRSWELLELPDMPSAKLQALLRPSAVRMQSLGLGDYYRITVPTNRQFFNAYMQRFHAMLTRSEPNQDQVDSYARGIESAVPALGIDLGDTFTHLLNETMYVPGEVRVRPPTPEMASHITADNTRAWSRRVALAPMEVAITGDIPLEEALDALKYYVGSLPDRPRISRNTFDDLRTSVLNPLPHIGTAEVQSLGTRAGIYVKGFYVCEQEHPDAEALRVAMNILNARLVGEAPLLGLPGGGSFNINFLQQFPGTSFMYYVVQGDHDAEAWARYCQTVNTMFQRFATDGPTLEEVGAAAEDLARDQETSVGSATGWWDILSLETYKGRDSRAFRTSPERYRAMTPQAVRDAFNRYFSRQNNVIELAAIPAAADELLQFVVTPPPPPPAPEQGDGAGSGDGGDAAGPQPAGPDAPGGR